MCVCCEVSHGALVGDSRDVVPSKECWRFQRFHGITLRVKTRTDSVQSFFLARRCYQREEIKEDVVRRLAAPSKFSQLRQGASLIIFCERDLPFNPKEV